MHSLLWVAFSSLHLIPDAIFICLLVEGCTCYVAYGTCVFFNNVYCVFEDLPINSAFRHSFPLPGLHAFNLKIYLLVLSKVKYFPVLYPFCDSAGWDGYIYVGHRSTGRTESRILWKFAKSWRVCWVLQNFTYFKYLWIPKQETGIRKYNCMCNSFFTNFCSCWKRLSSEVDRNNLSNLTYWLMLSKRM